jgi:hypothetical protein
MLVMSLTEIKESVTKLSPQERLLLSAFLAELEEADEARFQAQVDSRMRAMDAGQKMAMTEFERRHTAQKAKGF